MGIDEKTQGLERTALMPFFRISEWLGVNGSKSMSRPTSTLDGRGYHAVQKFLRNVRRAKLVCRLAGTAWLSARPPYGVQAALARALGVSLATISRDLRALRDPAYRMPVLGTCPPHLAHLERGV